jgi:hypothetical protein
MDPPGFSPCTIGYGYSVMQEEEKREEERSVIYSLLHFTPALDRADRWVVTFRSSRQGDAGIDITVSSPVLERLIRNGAEDLSAAEVNSLNGT